MMRAGKSEVVCDLAETYGILDYRGLPAETLAVLCIGLRDDSRIKMKLAGMKTDTKTLLMAAMVDHLALLVWSKTKDAETGRNRPKSIVQTLTAEESDGDIVTFDTPEDFEAMKKKILEGA
jgi:hypothetical protein